MGAVRILENQSLRAYNTFGVEAKAQWFAAFNSVDALREILSQKLPVAFILGGGSNLLLTRDVPGLVAKNEITGIQVESETADSIIVSAGGGAVWHPFVQWCVAKGYGGIENLSLIPGTVGAAPIQNIGAYGVEIKDVFEYLEALELSTGKIRTFLAEDCRFGYRDSVFKQELKGQYCILKVAFRLTKTQHRLHTTYGAIQETLAEMAVAEPDITSISEAVIRIRTSKLPDPAQLGNAGSFFKNPEVDATQFSSLHQTFPNIPHYSTGEGRQKIPAGWLIEQCGWKGKRSGDAGCYEKQALVLVNYGQASGREILDLARAIIASVEAKFGIALTPEVNLI
ncbi:MAG: UDP-N-acetylmuramate dehydrogenase [Saprospiraceae bacterium]